tara:strand:+ start:780 stop:1088 length:309 start_codon:yes stop_codon:yes gene_type:complete
MASKGRPTGSKNKHCLIKDELILPYEIHIDESTNSYLKVVAATQNTVGYFASMPHLLKSILQEKHVPQGKNGKVYNLKEYVTAMNTLTNAMAKILVPPHHKI